MVPRSTPKTAALAALLVLAACGGGSNVSNASPRIDSVPQQSVAGGATFSLDLADYVSDREGASLTYAVTSGGGSFAGSTYSHTFDTMGEYTVEFTVTDGQKTTTGEFAVRVTSAELVVVREDTSGLLLLDADTDALVRVAGTASSPALAAGLGDGRLVYQLTGAQGDELYLFDPMTRLNTRVAPNASGAVTYRGKTSDDKLVYTTGSASLMTIFYYNPTTGVSREIAQGAGSTLTVLVDSSDHVYYEVDQNGQSDVYYYDPSEDDSFAVATGSTDEQLQAVLAGGGAVLSRGGSNGETDLFAFTRAGGLVEIGGDLSATVQNQTKTYGGRTSDDKVVFEVTAAGSVDLYVWNKATGASRAIATGANDERFAAVTAADGIVFREVQSSTDDDLLFYDWDTDAVDTIRATTDDEDYLGSLSNGDVVFRAYHPGDTSNDLHIYDVSTGNSAVIADSGGDDYEFQAILANDHVVYLHDTGTPVLYVYDPVGASSTTVQSGSAPTYGGETAGGDFVFGRTNSSQTDLYLWDESAGAAVPISTTSGDDAFQAYTAAGKVLFTRVVTGNTTADLFVWDGTTATQLTDEDGAGLTHDHTVLGQYSGSR